MFSLVCTEGWTSNFDDWNVAEFCNGIRVLMETLSKSLRNIFEDPCSQVFFSHTENHWQTVSSLDDFMVFLDLKLNPAEDRKDWIFVLDLASIHRAAEFRAKVPDHIHIVHIPAQATSYCQPCDLTIPSLTKLLQKIGLQRKLFFEILKTVIFVIGCGTMRKIPRGVIYVQLQISFFSGRGGEEEERREPSHT